jgi:hypothetical protein
VIGYVKVIRRGVRRPVTLRTFSDPDAWAAEVRCGFELASRLGPSSRAVMWARGRLFRICRLRCPKAGLVAVCTEADGDAETAVTARWVFDDGR